MILTFAAHAEVIDRIAVSVGNRVITASDLERQIRVVAFQNGVKPDFGAESKHRVVEKMIEQKLIQRELENSRYPLPTEEDLPPVAAESRALAEYGITEQDVRDVLLWERQLLRYIEIRFETGIQVSDQEVQEYARLKNVPAADAERALVSERADRQLDQWLRDVRRRTDVIVHEEVLR